METVVSLKPLVQRCATQYEVQGEQAEEMCMRNVLHVPKLACNLFSVRAAVSRGNSVKFGKQCWIKDSNGSLIGMGSLRVAKYI